MNRLMAFRFFAVLSFMFILEMVYADNEPFFPTGIALTQDGSLVMSERGRKCVSVYSSDGKNLKGLFTLSDSPTGLAVEGDRIYVTTFGAKGYLHALDVNNGKELYAVETGSGACNPVVNECNDRIYVCNQFQNNISEVDPVTGKVTRTVNVLREPVAAVVTKDGRWLYVANFLPAQRADTDHVSACVSVIDLQSFRKVKDIRLANGSNALHGICVSPDGKFIYVTHNLGRYTVPTSQLHQGWMNTSAFSVIDTQKQEFVGSVILDDPERGAAGVWGIACDDDYIAVSHSGTHEVSLINHEEMLERFLACPDKSMLEYDLTFLYGSRRRVGLEGNGPRSICLSDGKLYVPTYFADVLNVVDVATADVRAVNLNPNRQETEVHKGEKYFNDASNCFQGWQSCNGCHPGDGRADGMNWDLMNDGIGNPKNCKSMLFSHVTPPSMISGIRASADLAVRAGFRFIQFFEISEEDAQCVDAYLRSLEPVPSPYLVDGELSEKAKEGKKVYQRLKCDDCHSGVYYTDMKMYRIGEDVEFEQGWDTPTLREVWRTAPYLFDGRAATMEEVFEVHRHGIDRKVSKKDIEALTEYVNSL